MITSISDCNWKRVSTIQFIFLDSLPIINWWCINILRRNYVLWVVEPFNDQLIPIIALCRITGWRGSLGMWVLVANRSLARLNFPILHKTLRASMGAPSSPGTILAWGLRGTISRLSDRLVYAWLLSSCWKILSSLLSKVSSAFFSWHNPGTILGG